MDTLRRFRGSGCQNGALSVPNVAAHVAKILRPERHVKTRCSAAPPHAAGPGDRVGSRRAATPSTRLPPPLPPLPDWPQTTTATPDLSSEPAITCRCASVPARPGRAFARRGTSAAIARGVLPTAGMPRRLKPARIRSARGTSAAHAHDGGVAEKTTRPSDRFGGPARVPPRSHSYPALRPECRLRARLVFAAPPAAALPGAARGSGSRGAGARHPVPVGT